MAARHACLAIECLSRAVCPACLAILSASLYFAFDTLSGLPAKEAPKEAPKAEPAEVAEDSDSTEDPPEKEDQKEQKLTWPGPPPKTDRMDPRMQARPRRPLHHQETLQKLHALGGSGADEEKAKRMQAATAAADSGPRVDGEG
eukprot:Skav212586  [mRNA]  locus=scaffold125:467788:469854:- [translate_table: standard]